MFVIRNSLRAFICALLVFLAYHGVMSSLGLATFLANHAPLPTPDRTFQIFLERVAIDGSLLFAGHWLLRSFGIASRLAYGLMGGAATVIGYIFALSNGFMMWPPLPGAQVTAAILPAFIGMISSSLYVQLAGREFIPPASSDTASGPFIAPSPTLFDGPVRVRSSMSATLIAAIVPAVILVLIGSPVFLSLLQLEGSGASSDWAITVTKLAAPSYFLVTALMMTAIPAMVVVQATHTLARAMNRTRGIDYAAIGSVLGCIASLALAWWFFPPILLPAAAVAGALMGAIYRRFAGLEPLPLPEPVLATDPTHLVGEDHPTRRGHTVIMNG